MGLLQKYNINFLAEEDCELNRNVNVKTTLLSYEYLILLVVFLLKNCC